MDPDKGNVKPVLITPARIYGFTLSKSGDKMALFGTENESLTEIYLMDLPGDQPEQITDFTGQIKNWKYSRSEVIS